MKLLLISALFFSTVAMAVDYSYCKKAVWQASPWLGNLKRPVTIGDDGKLKFENDKFKSILKEKLAPPAQDFVSISAVTNDGIVYNFTTRTDGTVIGADITSAIDPNGSSLASIDPSIERDVFGKKSKKDPENKKSVTEAHGSISLTVKNGYCVPTVATSYITLDDKPKKTRPTLVFNSEFCRKLDQMKDKINACEKVNKQLEDLAVTYLAPAENPAYEFNFGLFQGLVGKDKVKYFGNSNVASQLVSLFLEQCSTSGLEALIRDDKVWEGGNDGTGKDTSKKDNTTKQ